MIARKREPYGAPLIVRATQYCGNGEDPFLQYFAVAIDILQQVFERAKSLLKSTHNLVPSVIGEYLRQEVAEPGVMVVTCRKFKRNAELAEGRFQAVLQFPKIGRSGLLQLANDFQIRRARRAQAGIEHFVPRWLRRLSVPRHSRLLWLTGNSLSCKVGT